MPFAFHWYESLVPFVQVPGAAVSFVPTFAVPLTFGVVVVRTPAATGFEVPEVYETAV